MYGCFLPSDLILYETTCSWRSLRHLPAMERSTNTQAFDKRIIPAGFFRVWCWFHVVFRETIDLEMGWSNEKFSKPSGMIPSTKANKFRKEHLHSSRVGYARLGPATAWVSNIWLLPHRLWWLQLGGSEIDWDGAGEGQEVRETRRVVAVLFFWLAFARGHYMPPNFFWGDEKQCKCKANLRVST